MAISGWNGVPYGSVFNGNFPGHPSVDEIHSDGAVDPAFCQPGDEFIRTIDDARVQDFLCTGLAPNAGWEKGLDGQWNFEHQQLGVKSGKVTLRSWIMEDGSKVTHHIEAPYRWDTLAVQKTKSTEGFKITSA